MGAGWAGTALLAGLALGRAGVVATAGIINRRSCHQVQLCFGFSALQGCPNALHHTRLLPVAGDNLASLQSLLMLAQWALDCYFIEVVGSRNDEPFNIQESW